VTSERESSRAPRRRSSEKGIVAWRWDLLRPELGAGNVRQIDSLRSKSIPVQQIGPRAQQMRAA
jgi:hypothetical protein